MSNNKIQLLVFIGLAFGLSIAAEAKVPWQSNKLREQKKVEKIQAEIDAIPLMTGRAEGDYDILGPVRGEDALTNKRTYIYNKMRQVAYEMGADAVVEVRCKKMLNWLAQSCEGFGIKYRNEKAEETPSESDESAPSEASPDPQ
ncbi:MAG: hypothetical protein HY541_03785 [Deltaproteobacteria bacterium]|nr:hypothetical protein [Deltaproteobacteria bacterium]